MRLGSVDKCLRYREECTVNVLVKVLVLERRCTQLMFFW